MNNRNTGGMSAGAGTGTGTGTDTMGSGGGTFNADGTRVPRDDRN